MAWQFVVIDGADKGRHYPLNAGTLVIGNSHRNSDICLHDLIMSRVHCQLDVSADQVVVADIEGSSGTLVNGQKVQSHTLKPGDVLRVGNSQLRLEAAGGQPPAASAAAAPAAVAPAAAAPAEHVKVPHLPLERFDELAGHTLSHYVLETVLGRGFLGVTFRAHDVKNDRVVALKVIHPDFPKKDEEMQHFVQVMKRLLPLRHPNLVGSWGAGKAGGYCWVAMEYVEGKSVAGVLKRTNPDKKIKWQRPWRIAMHIAAALEYIHQHRFVHHNVTPQNILVQDGDLPAKLSNLMLEQALEGSEAQLTTLEAKLLAELPYLSPEQARGEGKGDRRSDIYSLGVVTYALLTGHVPFQRATPEETLARIQENVLPTLPRRYQKAIPEPLEVVVERMIANDPDDRYQDATALLADLKLIAKEHDLSV